MEGLVSSATDLATSIGVLRQFNPFLTHSSNFFISITPKDWGKRRVGCHCARKVDCKNASLPSHSSIETAERALEMKEWEVKRLENEIAKLQGITIRRWKPTSPPHGYEGPFEFRWQKEGGNTPRNIFEEIIWNKAVEVLKGKESYPVEELKEALSNAPPPRDFIGSLRESHARTGLPALIAEVKKASPSRGVLRQDFDPVAIARAYEKGGAACLSVLTDEKYFQGSFMNLEAIRNGVQCPLLCKEFVIDPWQLYYARLKGADAVLLIAAVLPDIDIQCMIDICNSIGLTALVEVHNENEIDRIVTFRGVQLIGINNRDLQTFNVDIANTNKLLQPRLLHIQHRDIIVVAESGLFTPTDIAYVQEAGVKAVLVGESLVKQPDPAAAIAKLFGRNVSA